MSFPVSIKGVLLEAGRVVLLENEREEWELPGGRLETGEDPMACLVREFAEELGVSVIIKAILDCWLYEVLPARYVVIVTYGVERAGVEVLRLSASIGGSASSRSTNSTDCRCPKATGVPFVLGLQSLSPRRTALRVCRNGVEHQLVEISDTLLVSG